MKPTEQKILMCIELNNELNKFFTKKNWLHFSDFETLSKRAKHTVEYNIAYKLKKKNICQNGEEINH